MPNRRRRNILQGMTTQLQIKKTPASHTAGGEKRAALGSAHGGDGYACGCRAGWCRLGLWPYCPSRHQADSLVWRSPAVIGEWKFLNSNPDERGPHERVRCDGCVRLGIAAHIDRQGNGEGVFHGHARNPVHSPERTAGSDATSLCADSPAGDPSHASGYDPDGACRVHRAGLSLTGAA